MPPVSDDSMDRAVMAEFISDQSAQDSGLHETEELLEVSHTRPLRVPAAASPIDPRTRTGSGDSAEEYGRSHAAATCLCDTKSVSV